MNHATVQHWSRNSSTQLCLERSLSSAALFLTDRGNVRSEIRVSHIQSVHLGFQHVDRVNHSVGFLWQLSDKQLEWIAFHIPPRFKPTWLQLPWSYFLPLGRASQPLVGGSLTFETSRPTWVSVQDVVLKRQKTVHANQVNQSQSSATFTAHRQATKEMSLLLSLCFLLTCHFSLTQNRCGVACWHLSVNFTKMKNTCRHKKSLHQDMVCLFK